MKSLLLFLNIPLFGTVNGCVGSFKTYILQVFLTLTYSKPLICTRLSAYRGLTVH